MKVSGFSFVRNAVKFDYPFLESIQSILPLCDEFVIAVGKSDDDTLERIRALQSPKIRVIETVWDESLRTGGKVLAQQTNIALDHVSGDWAFYLQADEVVHENDLPVIRQAMQQYLSDMQVEGLLFSYHHFYGSYRYVGASRRWYRREVRVVRTGIGVRSWGDAQGFRIDGRKLRVKPVEAAIYHYGWVKPPAIQQAKQRSFNRLWHPNEWVEKNIPQSVEYDYSQGGKLKLFEGTHPAVIGNRVASADWMFEYDPARVRQPLKEKLLDWVEARWGVRIGEYKNYELI
jgi:glycosyltransferase involved in cell wall biosynthesis